MIGATCLISEDQKKRYRTGRAVLLRRCLGAAWIDRGRAHRDTSYTAFDRTDIVRTWICVDPSPGPITLSIVKGSHLWGRTFRATPPDVAGSCEASAEAAGSVRAPACNVIPGLSRMAGKQLDTGTSPRDHADIFPVIWRQARAV